ncbi:MAG: sucrase ferredoxin [Chloroflexota bacterium]
MSDYCSQLAQQMQAPLYGTASTFQVALLLEFNGAWNGKAVANNDLPESIKVWVQDQQNAVEGLRPLWIKRATPSQEKTLYIGVTDRAVPRLYRIHFQAYEELLSLDVAALLRGETDHQPVKERVVAVCTNGKHDLCCAKFGLPIYQALEAESDISAWQCTHIGGHRYAATAVVLPTGVTYGYLTPENIGEVAQAIRDDTIYLPCYRGSAAYSGAVNAAEYFLRMKNNQTMLNALTAIHSEKRDQEWQVHFRNGREEAYMVGLSESTTDPVISSCGDKPPKPQMNYQLLQIQSPEPV